MRLSFFNIDSVFDFLLAIGMKPFIELGFMPEALASGKVTCFHYKANITPPADYDQWGGLIRELTRHQVDRYGIEEVRSWFFEVWNEPNLKFFWAGTNKRSQIPQAGFHNPHRRGACQPEGEVTGAGKPRLPQ